MRLELTGRHVDITDGIRRAVNGKLARLERRLNDSAVSAQVVLSAEKTGRRADVTLHAKGETFLHASGRGANVTAAIAEAVDKLAQQAGKVKGKWQTRKRTATRVIERPDVSPEPSAAAVPPRARAARPRVLRGTRQAIAPMSIREASALVDAGTSVVLFRDTETRLIAVVYRAPGGDLTLIHGQE